jgi:hypothetical protein
MSLNGLRVPESDWTLWRGENSLKLTGIGTGLEVDKLQA